MTAPVAMARQTPAGIHLENGHRTLINFAYDPDVSLWEVEVTPPGFDGGDPVDTTHMHRTKYRGKAPRTLIDMTDAGITCFYDPAVITQIRNLLNRETTITIHFPDGSTWAAYGFLRVFTPDPNVEGEAPTATVAVTMTNSDPTSGAEEEPVLVSVAGT